MLHWGLMALLVAFHIAPVVATAAGAALGAIANYLLQFHITFQARARHSRALPAYAAVVLVGWLANLLVFMGLHTGLGLASALAQGLTTLLVALLNFWFYTVVVFDEKPITAADS